MRARRGEGETLDVCGVWRGEGDVGGGEALWGVERLGGGGRGGAW